MASLTENLQQSTLITADNIAAVDEFICAVDFELARNVAGILFSM